MILWRDPLYLWIGLPAVVVLGGFLLLHLRRRAALLRAFADAPLVPRLAPDADERRSLTRMLVRVAALALLAVGLAGPKWGFHWQEVHREGIDLIVAVDTSRSMLATDVKPNRLERAKFAIMDLLPLLQGDRIGLVAFAGTAFLECPLTLDYAAFEQSLRAVEVGIIPRGGTAIARAIDTSLDAFDARQGKYEAIILITDGENTEGDVKEAAKRAADLGVKVFTVGIGTAEGELLSLGKDGFVKDRNGQVVKSRLNEDTLKDIALTTGGAYVQGLGPSLGLDQVFRDHIATMERREVASTLERRYEERFQIPLALALLLLIAEALIAERRPAPGARRWRRSPSALPRQAAAALVLLCLPALVGWLDPPGDLAAEGNSLYASGKYEDAASKYGEGLIDAPASPLLQFNLATALYKQGKYDDAIAALTKVAALGDAQWVAPTNYNMGNAYYRLASNAESSDPQKAIKNYEEALACYKRSMVADAADTDAKLNHEFVARKYDEFKKKLEEQKKQQEEQKQKQEEQQQKQEQQQQDQSEQQPPQDQHDQQQDQQQGQQDQQQQDQQQQAGGEDQQQQQQQQQQEEQQQQQQQAGEQQQQDQQQAQQQPEQQGGGGADEQGEQQAQQQPGAAGEARTSDEAEQSPDQKAAHAVLDTARQEELSPEDIDRAVGVAGVGEPVQDW